MAGTITYTHKGGQEAFSGHASGKLVLDVSEAENIIIGFKPSRVELILADAGGTADAILTWMDSMTTGHHLRVANDGEITFPTTLGVVVYDGASGQGFTIPASQTGAADSDVIYWTAWR